MSKQLTLSSILAVAAMAALALATSLQMEHASRDANGAGLVAEQAWSAHS